MISESFPNTAQAARAARHCDELLSRAATPVDLEAEFTRFVRQIADQAQPLLAELCDNRGLTVTMGSIACAPAADWLAQLGAGGLHGFYSLGQDKRGALVSTSVGELVAQFERILGGTGEVDEDCHTLPSSAACFARQFEAKVASLLQRASDRREFAVSASGEHAHEIMPFAGNDKVWTVVLTATPKGAASAWSIRFALCQATLNDLVGARAVSPATGRSIGARGLDGSAIGHVELPLRAVLVDVPMAISRIAQLTEGAMIPVAIQRNVPVLIGNTTIAHGSVGELDDRVAMELTHTNFTGNL